jgi:hypothetical protein
MNINIATEFARNYIIETLQKVRLLLKSVYISFLLLWNTCKVIFNVIQSCTLYNSTNIFFKTYNVTPVDFRVTSNENGFDFTTTS